MTVYCIDCGKIIWYGSKRCRSCNAKLPKTEGCKKKISKSLTGKKMPWISESNHKKRGVKLPKRTEEHIDGIRQSRIKNGSYSDIGDTYTDSRGYVCVKVTHGKKYNYRHLHRVVVEKHIGRPLTRKEMVHHLDGNKANNDISNLVILSYSQHNTINHVITKMNRDDDKRTFTRALLETIRKRCIDISI